MRAKIAKNGRVHFQQSMFETDERDVPDLTEDEIYEANRGKPGYPDMTPDPARAVSYEHLFTTFLEAYRAGEPIDDVKVSVADGKRLRPDEVLIISPDKKTHHGWITTRTRAHKQYANEVKEKAESTPQKPTATYDPAAPLPCVSAEVAYEAMMDALRDNIDPFMVEIKADSGAYVRVCQASIRGMGGAQMSVYELLKIVRMDHRDEMQAAREEVENLVTDDFSM